MTRRKPLAGIYHLTTFLALALLLLILFISAAYFFFIPAPDHASEDGDLLAVLAQQRATWEAQRPAAFRYVIDRECYCERTYVEPYVAIEEHGSKSAAFAIEIESPSGDFISAPPGPVWIDDLFDLIEQSVREEKAVDVEYHEELGYPTSLVVHPEPAPPDSVYRVDVRDFEILEYR
jgi:hypothetical protein